MKDLTYFLPLLIKLDILQAFSIPIYSFWTWFKFFLPETTSVPETPKKQGRQLLKLLVLAAAALPSMEQAQSHYTSKKGNLYPEKVITSTANLSAYNLVELHESLAHSSLLSLFSGLLTSPITPILLDCGASACTSPSLEVFLPGILTPLKTPIQLQGVGGGVKITQLTTARYLIIGLGLLGL